MDNDTLITILVAAVLFTIPVAWLFFGPSLVRRFDSKSETSWLYSSDKDRK